MDTKVNKPVPSRSSSSTGIADTYRVSKFMGNAMGKTSTGRYRPQRKDSGPAWGGQGKEGWTDKSRHRLARNWVGWGHPGPRMRNEVITEISIVIMNAGIKCSLTVHVDDTESAVFANVTRWPWKSKDHP